MVFFGGRFSDLTKEGHIQKHAPVLEPFCTNGKTQIALINTIQSYCYEDTRVIKAFVQILKVLLPFLAGSSRWLMANERIGVV